MASCIAVPTEWSLTKADALVRSGRIADGMAMAEALWQALAATDRVAERADCQRVLAVAHQVAGRLREALMAGFHAIELYEQAGHRMGLSRMLSLQAVALARHGDPGEALNLARRAIDIVERIDDAAATARVWNNVSVVYEALGQLPRAVQALEQALPRAAQANDPDLQAVLTCNLWLYRLASARTSAPRPAFQDIERALRALQQHMAACESTGRPHLVGSMADPAGEALAELGRLDEARATLRMGLRCLREVGLVPELARLELRMTRVERLAGQFDRAAEHIARALDLAIQGDDKDVISRCHLEHSQLQEAQGQWQPALESFRQHAAVREALLKAQAETAAQVLTVRMEAERARLEAELLQLRNAELERDMRQLATEAEQLTREAQEDPLTGLGNRRRFQARVARMREPGAAGDATLALLLADVDHFKRINDGFSHAVGDEVLRQIGQLLRTHSRPSDTVARFGGEEFVVAFGGGASLDQAEAAAERIRQVVEAHDWAAVQPGLAVTLSIGLAEATAGEPVEQALDRADQALYAAKRAGRNRICRG